MFLFSILWIPLFFLFWRAISPSDGEKSGGVWAFVIGVLICALQFFVETIVFPGDFGFSRWLSGFLAIVFLPVLIPFGFCAIFLFLRILSGDIHVTNFLFSSLIPVSVFRALSYGTILDPIRLMIIPVLWSALAVGMPLFMRLIQNGYGAKVLFSVFSCIALPFLAATAYWALFCNKLVLGFALFILTLIPMIVSVAMSYARGSK